MDWRLAEVDEMSEAAARETLTDGAARIFSLEEMVAPHCIDVCGGVAAVYSSRCPAAEAPNQDGAALFGLAPDRAVFAVADGLGGQPGGASASRLALEALRDALEPTRLATDSVRGAVLDGIETANRNVLDLGIGAGTTLAAVEIVGGLQRAYHVGDSEVLVVGQRGRIKLQTIPHSPVGYGVEAGLLDQDEAMHHDERHIVSNLVGSSEMRIEVGSPLSLARRDTVLLATDGLFDNLGVAEIVETIRSGPVESVAETLAVTCKERMNSPVSGQPSKPDDLTFILYRSA